NTVGGTTPAARNVLSGNAFEGVAIYDSGTTLNLVEGNFIGTKVTGASALANGAAGVIVFGGAHGNTIGGVSATARNLISGNAFDGITIVDSGTSSNVVAANYIGTKASGL